MPLEMTPAEELRHDLQINQHGLELELLHQPMLFDKYSARAAEIRLRRDNLKTALKVRAGEISKDYRITGIPGGIKSTEGAIEEAIARNPELAQMAYELNEAERDLNLAEGVVEAFKHRKASLDNLCYLATSSYYQVSSRGDATGVTASTNEARRALNKKD